MGRFDVERRADGSLLLTARGGGRWGAAALGLAGGLILLGAVLGGRASPLERVLLVPLGVIALLAGAGALRHRDWMLFDRQARQVVQRRGLRSMFRAAAALPFDDVESVVVEGGAPDGVVALWLRCAGDARWPVDRSADAEYVARLCAAVQEAGRWPVARRLAEARA